MGNLPMSVKTEGLALSVAEAAEALGISEALARRLAREGELPGARKLGSRYVVSARELRDWADRSGTESLNLSVLKKGAPVAMTAQEWGEVYLIVSDALNLIGGLEAEVGERLPGPRFSNRLEKAKLILKEARTR
jgi:excisionase family DNA binding protein